MVELAQLEQIGLTRNEATIYVALLETGETKTGALSKKTHLHRVLIYDALESLIQKGLASYCIKENIKYFQAANPKIILKFLDEKVESAKKLIPTLEVLRPTQAAQSVVVYESTRGVKSAVLNMIEDMGSSSSNVCFGSGNMLHSLGEGFFNLFQKLKTEKKIMTRLIFDTTFKNSIPVVSEYTVCKFYSLGPFPTDTWVYGDKVLIVNYSALPFAILITSKETAQSYLTMFEGYWKKALTST